MKVRRAGMTPDPPRCREPWQGRTSTWTSLPTRHLWRIWRRRGSGSGPRKSFLRLLSLSVGCATNTGGGSRKTAVALTQDEAVEAYKRVAPLYPPDMTDKEEEAALQADMNAIACRLESGEIVFRGPAVEEILEGFEGMIAKGSDALYITEARGEEDSWSRFVAYKAIRTFRWAHGCRTARPRCRPARAPHPGC